MFARPAHHHLSVLYLFSSKIEEVFLKKKAKKKKCTLGQFGSCPHFNLPGLELAWNLPGVCLVSDLGFFCLVKLPGCIRNLSIMLSRNDGR